MSYPTEIGVDTHHAVGPIGEMYGHPLVLQIGTFPRQETPDAIFACAECGYTHSDQRAFAHTDCDRERNGINTTLAERYDL